MISKTRRQALEMHLSGRTYAQIAEALDLKWPASARREVQRALDQIGEPGDSKGMSPAVRTAVARLDALLASVWPAARRGDTAAVDRVLRIETERRKLLALGLVSSAETGDIAAGASSSVVDEFTRKLAARRQAAGG